MFSWVGGRKKQETNQVLRNERLVRSNRMRDYFISPTGCPEITGAPSCEESDGSLSLDVLRIHALCKAPKIEVISVSKGKLKQAFAPRFFSATRQTLTISLVMAYLLRFLDYWKKRSFHFKCFVLCRGICISFRIFPPSSLPPVVLDVSVRKTGNHTYAINVSTRTPRRQWQAEKLNRVDSPFLKYTRKNSARWFMQNTLLLAFCVPAFKRADVAFTLTQFYSSDAKREGKRSNLCSCALRLKSLAENATRRKEDYSQLKFYKKLCVSRDENYSNLEAL